MDEDRARRFAEIFAGDSMDGMPRVRAPGETPAQQRARHAAEGILVARDSWASILASDEKMNAGQPINSYKKGFGELFALLLTLTERT